jgi:hypothetical protein
MTEQLSKGGGSMSRLTTRRIAALALLFGLSLVAVSGCRGSDGGAGSGTAPAVESNGSEGSVAPDYGSEDPVAPDYRSDEPSGSDYGSSEPTGSDHGSTELSGSDPEPSTDPCAFPDDPLCSRTPVKVPPPSISNWP